MGTEQRQANGLTVEKYNIIGTHLWVYGAWERTSALGSRYEGHSTIQSANDGGWLGRVGTRRLTPELDALAPYSQERFDAVCAFYDAQYAEAYAAIVAAFPEAAEGRRDAGEITYVS